MFDHFSTLWVKELWEDTAHRNFLFIIKQKTAGFKPLTSQPNRNLKCISVLLQESFSQRKKVTMDPHFYH